MPEDYYNDSPPADQTEMPADSSKTPEEKDEQQDEKTALIPESLCPGMKVGEEVVLEIVAVHEDEYEVKYAPEKGKEKGDKKSEPSMDEAAKSNQAVGGGNSGMASYMD